MNSNPQNRRCLRIAFGAAAYPESGSPHPIRSLSIGTPTMLNLLHRTTIHLEVKPPHRPEEMSFG